MLYKYRLQISILFYFCLSALGIYLWGHTGCSDGWQSTSIGSRGACSHHGGVRTNIYIFIILAIFPSYMLYKFIEGKYRTYNRYIVSVNLPIHPIEDKLLPYKKYILYKKPTLTAKARQGYICEICKNRYRAGTAYIYYNKGSKRIRHCKACKSNLPSLNREIAFQEYIYIEQRDKQKEIIEGYYKENAKAKLDL